jgi:DNA-binding NtrC family response regulator
MTTQIRAMTDTLPGNSSQTPKNPQTHVLIVDGERLLRWAIGETLTEHGYVVSEAGDAKSALKALVGLPTLPDLVLLDLFLPDACDLRVLELIRTAVPAVPVILMSASATPDIVEQALAMGARVIPKPFDMDILSALIDRTVATRPQ